jgi:hypothetical protein
MRIRWRFSILWTIVCLAVLGASVAAAGRPSEPGCFEYCTLNADVGRLLVPLSVIIWLAVLSASAWLWGRATTRVCSNCGRRVDNARRSCPSCAHELGGPSAS